jgi:hypothetical protein
METGALVSKNLTIDSTYFKLSNTGKITSITSDLKKLVMESGKITGYKADGTQSAALEIGDGYFNIIGKLALNGHVGVNGTADYIKSIAYTSTSIVTSATATGLQQTGSFLTGLGFPSGGLVTTDTLYYMNQYGTASYATVVTGVTFPTYNPTTANALTQVPVYSFTSGFFDVPNFLDITRGQMIATDGLISEVIG